MKPDRLFAGFVKLRAKLLFTAVLACLSSLSLAQSPSPLGKIPTPASTTVQAKPKLRIITLAPHLAQLAQVAGAGDWLVGVTEYTPAAYAGDLPKVGNAFAVNWRLIAELKPDWVLVWGSGNSPATQAKLKALGLKVFVSEPKTLADIVAEPETLARLLGVTTETAGLKQLRADYAELQRFNGGKSSQTLKIFHPIWPKPLMTVGAPHVITEALRHCGARNVFGTLPLITPTVTLAQVLRAQPDLIVLARSQAEAENNPADTWSFLLNAFPKKTAPAITYVNGDAFHQPGASLIPETLKLCQTIAELKR